MSKNENESGTVKNPLIQDKSKSNEILEVLHERERKGNLPEREIKQVYLDRVYTTQPYLYENKLNDYIDKPIHEFAEGYLYNGDVLITDGNHRIALAKLNNQTLARMSVIDLNKKPDNIIKKIFKRKKK